MSDLAQDAQGRQNGTTELSFRERVKLEVTSVFARRDMISDGRIDQYLVADEIEPTVLKAVVKVESDRAKVGVTPTRVMEVHFPEVQRRSDVESDDEDELEFIDAVYGAVKSEVFRVLNVMPVGVIQSRLAENGDGLVLCRMRGRRGTEEVAYVTRNRKCIYEDNLYPAFHGIDLAIAKAAALTGMSIDRVPEAGRWFFSEYKASTKQSLASADHQIRAALEAVTDEPEADSGPAEDDDE